MTDDSSPRSVAGKQTEWMVPSDQMILRRYKPLRYFSETLEHGFRAGQAKGYEEREGQASEPAQRYEQQHSEQTESMTLSNGKEMDLAGGLEQSRKDARANYYANCWRLGTDESENIWEGYADLKEGVAIETTFGQVQRFISPGEELFMGIVRYLDYEEEVTPTKIPYSLYFFKHREYDDEQEFRILANRGGNPVIWADGRESPTETETNPDAITLPTDMGSLINRVILAPEADEEVRSEVEETLEDYGISAPVVPSRLTDTSPHLEGYHAELSGAANYEGTEDYLKSAKRRFVSDTDWDTWETVDVVQLNQRGNLRPRETFLECFRHVSDPPDPEEYGQSHLNYEVRVTRFRQGEYIDTFRNDVARLTDSQLDTS